MREKRNTVKTNNQELLTRKENESDATSRWTLVQKTNLFKEQRLSRKYHNKQIRNWNKNYAAVKVKERIR